MRVAGVDGCPSGWLVVTWQPESDLPPVVAIEANFQAILARQPQPDVIAIDIPIGLPPRVGRGGRSCDVAARRILGERQSAVFSVPARAAITATDYQVACDTAFAHSDPPRKVSKQCFNIFPKIRDVDGAMTPSLQERVIECHPEVAFWAMNSERALLLPKKVKSRPHEPGLEARRSLLRKSGFPIDLVRPLRAPRKDAGPDDLIDACACAWTAMRRLRGLAHRFPSTPERDARGLLMEIWA